MSQAGANGEMLEGMFMACQVIGGTSDGCVFTRRKGGWDADDGDRGGKQGVNESGRVEMKRFEVFDCCRVVGEGLRGAKNRRGSSANIFLVKFAFLRVVFGWDDHLSCSGNIEGAYQCHHFSSVGQSASS